MEHEQHEGSAVSGAPPSNKAHRPGLVKRLASVRLTLWILGILAVAMAVATIIPQKAPAAVYERAFGIVFGSFIQKTTLYNVYGSWWFIGAFALLAINLLACSLQQIARMFRQDKEHKGESVSITGVRASQHQASWKIALAPEAAAAAVSNVLRKQGYSVRDAVSKEAKQTGLAGKRRGLGVWASLLVHIGMLLVLLGAAYGRLPINSYQAIAPLNAGESFVIEEGEDGFSVKLLDAGQEQDENGRPTRYWARAEIIEHDKVIKSGIIEPNHPLIHRGVNIVLQSLSRGGYSVEVSQGEWQGFVPVIFTHDGGVAMLDTITKLEHPPWVVFIHDFVHSRESPTGKSAARVFIDKSGELSHSWETVGWVDETGMEYSGVHFRLIPASQGAQLSMDRDIGVPIVWFGFLVLTFGGLSLLSVTRRSLSVVIRAKGNGSQVLIGGSGAGVKRDLERADKRLKASTDSKVELDAIEQRKEP